MRQSNEIIKTVLNPTLKFRNCLTLQNKDHRNNANTYCTKLTSPNVWQLQRAGTHTPLTLAETSSLSD